MSPQPSVSAYQPDPAGSCLPPPESASAPLPEPSCGLDLVCRLTDHAVRGVAQLTGCEALAREYLAMPYRDHDERVRALINWESAKNFASGFVTGLGGLATLPVTLPSALTASWLLQARLSGAIACIYGHDLTEDRVRTLMLLSLLGDGLKEPLKQAGIRLGTQLTLQTLQALPGRLLIDLNRMVGVRLLTKAGEHGVINFTKLVPGVGGVIGGSFDLISCRCVGRVAVKLFRPLTPETTNGNHALSQSRGSVNQ